MFRAKNYMIFLLFFLLTSCENNEKMGLEADLALQNGKIYTVDPANPWASSVAIRSGKIIYIGNDRGAKQHIGSNTRQVDLEGKMVLPGFHDIHVHPVHAGVSYQQCSLFDIVGIDNILTKIKKCVEEKADAEWIVGHGWSIGEFTRENMPTKEALDKISSNKPISLKSSDGHSLWVNSLALEYSNINSQTPDPVFGHIERKKESTEPSGLLHEDSAMMLVMNNEPKLTEKDLIEGLEFSRDIFHSFGITGVQDAILKLEPGDAYYGLDAYNYLDQKDELNLHVVTAMLWENGGSLEEQLPQFLKTREQQSKSKNVRSTSIKFWQDGVIETHTAAMLEAYSDRSDGFRGVLQNSPEELDKAITALDAEGFQIHFHSIGDRAIKVAFDSIELARNTNGKRDSRHHISHLQVFDPDDIARFIELDVVANFQPLWSIQDKWITEFTWPLIGEERSRWLYPINTVLKTGAIIGFGSDWYVTSVNPLDGIEVAVTRLEPNGLTDIPLGENEEISLAEAIKSYTINSAYVNFLDDRAGSIEIGKQADLIILDKNLFDIEPSEINETKVMATLFNGKLVFGQF